MKLLPNRCMGLITGLALATMAAGAGQANEIFSTWLEPNHIIAKATTIDWSDIVRDESGGEIDFEVFLGGSLIPAKSTMQGVADGLAQVGLHTALYTPSDLPVSVALADMGFETPDAMLMSFVFADFMMNEKVGYDDWRKNGVIFGGASATPVYYFLCREPVRDLASFKGKRVRMPGGGWARFGESIGAVGVNIPSNEIYEAFDRGTVDCTASDATHITSGATLKDVIGAVTMLKMGPFFAACSHAYNPAFWQGLTNEQRRLLLDTTARTQARVQILFDQEVEGALTAAKEAGIELVEPDATLQDAYDTWAADGVGGMAKIAKEVYGIDDPEALFASFRTYVEKWQGLLADVDRTDEDALTALLTDNLYGLIDETSYGMD